MIFNIYYYRNLICIVIFILVPLVIFFWTLFIHGKKNSSGTTNLQRSEVKPWSQGWLIAAGAYPGFCSVKRLEVFLLPLDGMLVHRRSLPRNFARFPQQFAGTHLYTWVERGTVRVKCLAQEHNTMSPARARTRNLQRMSKNPKT